MAGEKMTLKGLYTKLDALKDKYEEEIIQLKETINQQEVRIKILERLPTNDKPIDIHKKPRNNDSFENFNGKNLEKNKLYQLKCKMCESRFCKFSILELHIKQEHGTDQEENCDECGKSFVTAWRLRKHARIHSEKFIKTFKYFIRNTFCPFEELGCKFRHDIPRKDTIEQNDDSMKDTIEQNDDSIKDTSSERKSLFFTSTPKKQECENCVDKTSQCDGCFVDNYIRNMKADREKFQE